MNATKHGLTARSVLTPGESATDWTTHRAAVLVDLSPKGALETSLAERVAELTWRLARAGAAEAAIARCAVEGAELEAVRSAIDAERNADGTLPSELGDVHDLASLASRLEHYGADAAIFETVIFGGPMEAAVEPSAARRALEMMGRDAGLNPAAPVLWAKTPKDAPKGALQLEAYTRRAVLDLAARLAREGEGTNHGITLAAKTSVRLKRALARLQHVEGDARRRIALAEGSAAVGAAMEPVRRHEAHLQRQLGVALATLRAVRESFSSRD